MAKTIIPPTTPAPTAPAARKTTGAATVAEGEATASKATMRLVDGVRDSFNSYVTAFVALNETRAQLAPRFMKAYNAWAADTGRSFVNFVRLFDPSVPLQAAEYRKHRTFMAADYLRRLVATEAREEAAEEAGETGIGAAAPATDHEAMVRLFAALLPFIAVEHHPKLWEILKTELHWTDTRINRLREQIGAAKPLTTMNPAKGQPRPTLFLVRRSA